MQVSAPGCENIVRFIADVVEAYTVALIYCNKSHSEMSCLCYHSLSKYFRPEKIIPIEKSGLLAQVITTQQMIHCDKLQNKPIYSIMPFYSQEEDLIKAFCVFPISDWNSMLYVDTKHKWSFSRKELVWIQQGVTLLSEALQNMEVCLQRDDYAELLTFLYAIDKALENLDNSSKNSLQDILNKTSQFIKADSGFLTSRKPPAGEIELECVTSSAAHFLKAKRINFSGTLIEQVFERRQPFILLRPSGQGKDLHVLYPGEPLSREECFYGFYEKTHDREWVMAFVSRRKDAVGSDHLYGARRAFRLLVREIEREHLRKECDFRTFYDAHTGFLNAKTFQMALQQKFHQAVSQNTSLALVLIQWEPYLTLCTLTTPELLLDWTRQIASALRSNLLSPDMTAGVLGENRIGIILSNPDHVGGYVAFARQCEHFLSGLELGKRLKHHLKFYTGVAVYPHEVAHIPELWNRAYASLIERTKTANGSSVLLSDDEALSVLVSPRRTSRA